MELGIYVHIPFCVKKCDYCDFISYSNCFDMQERYVEKLLEEIEENKNLLRNNFISTIYIGGGTPSAIKPELIKKILDKIYDVAEIEIEKNKGTSNGGKKVIGNEMPDKKEKIEITIEVNPGTTTKNNLQMYKNCGINRLNNQIGRCKSKDTVKVALYSTHNFEEPCISGKKGSGTVFFSNCNMNCVFCQNYEISQQGKGKEISIEELADIFIKQQEKDVENINLVTPTSYVPQIIEAIKIARKNGLKLPIVYNTNGYEKVETLKMLEGYVDIYLPDFKYSDNELGKRLSKVDNYFEIVTEAIKEMYRQTGKAVFNGEGIMQKGMIIRHLVLPNHILNSRRVLKWINENMHDVYVSVMAQYFPTYKAKEIDDINRKLTKEEYEQIENYLYRLDLENGYIQELGEHEEEYVPDWEFDL